MECWALRRWRQRFVRRRALAGLLCDVRRFWQLSAAARCASRLTCRSKTSDRSNRSDDRAARFSDVARTPWSHDRLRLSARREGAGPRGTREPACTRPKTWPALRGSRDARAMGSVGYKQVLACLEGQLPRDEMKVAIDRATKVFARRQRTWLRDRPIDWIDPTSSSGT